MSLKRRALRGATWAIAGGNASQVLAFVMFIIISRMVGPSAFGAVAIAIALVELCRAISSESVVGNLVGRGRFVEEEFNAGFAWSMGVAALLFAILVLLAPLLAAAFQTPALSLVLPAIASLLLIYAASRLQEARLTLDLAFRALAIRSVSAALIGGFVGIAAAYAGWGVAALVLQQLVAALISLILLWRACAWRPSTRFSRDTFLRLARESVTLAPAGLIANLSALADGLAVAAFSGPAAAGVYNLGKRVRLALQLGLSTALDRVSLPTFARVKDDPARLAHTINQAARVSMLGAFPIFIGVAAVSPELIHVFLGAEWAEAATPLTLLMIAGALAITTSFYDNLMLAMGRRTWIISLRLLMLLVLGASILLFGRFGSVAIAGASLTATFVHNAAAWAAAAQLAPLRLKSLFSAVAVPLALGLIMLGAITALRMATPFSDLQALPRLFIFIPFGALLYGAGAWMFARDAVRAAIDAARTVLANGAATPTREN